MGNLKVAGLDIGSHNLTIDESSGTLLVDGEEVSGSGGGISYVWANETARLATNGMKSDDQGVQQDNSTVYKYNGTSWEEYYVMSDSTVQKYYEGTSAPINSKIGDEWFDHTDGTLYKRVSDGTDSVWMAINSLAGGGEVDLSNYYTKSETDLLVDTKLTATNPSITGSITEQVYNLTGTAISPANGTIQYKTVSANTTFTETLTAGQSVLLRLINANSYTITFPAITWAGKNAPTLTANCAIVLWKEQSTLYGVYVGTLV